MKHTIISLLLALVFALPAFAAENTCHNMAGGTFGVAWLDSTGEIRLFDGQKSVRLMGFYEKGHQIVAFDNDGNGKDCLAIISLNNKSLYILDAEKTIETGKAVVLSGPNGNNVKAISAGVITKDDARSTLIASTYSGNSYLWNKDYDKKGWPPISGDFDQVSAGKIKANMPCQFVAITNGDVYTYNPVWNVYSQKFMGKNVKATICGNFVPTTKEDEIIAAGEENTWILIGKKVDPLDKVVKCMTVGKAADKDVLIAVDKDGALCQYDRTAKAWTTLVEDMTGFVSVVTAPNADGTYTIYARTIDGLYRISADGKTAELVDGQLKTRLPLKADGKVVAQFQTGGKYKPYVEQLFTPSGVQVLLDSPGDHVHHHGLMYSLSIDSAEFWGEYNDSCGQEVLTKCELSEDSSAIKAELDWTAPDGTVVAKEVREISVASVDGANVLNWKSVLTPAGDKAITIKGRYYFGLGMRFAKEMNSTVKFSNSTGAHDGAIVRGDERLKDCQWINAKGFVAGAPISVTIEDLPGNTRAMTGYSMGDGWKAFAYMGATMRVHESPILLEPGKSITAAYKIIVKDAE